MRDGPMIDARERIAAAGIDTRAEEEKRLIGERRSNNDRRSGADRRSSVSSTPKKSD
jgi:hypothetical protein